MDIVIERQQLILAQANTPLWGGYVNMLKRLESEFASPKHWVLEFLQNSEDAAKDNPNGRISIRLTNGALWILNNGKVFDQEDFAAICDVRSRKLPSLGFRGYIGVGFKSIFRITDRVDVHSGSLHFTFNRDWNEQERQNKPITDWPWEILPRLTDPVPLPEGFTTGFHIPFGSVDTLTHQEVDELRQFLNSGFPKEAILLLKYIKSIDVETPQTKFTITKQALESATLAVQAIQNNPVPGEQAASPVSRDIVLIKKQTDELPYPDEAKYLVFRRDVQIAPDVRADRETERVRRDDIKEREIGLVFSLDSSDNVRPLEGKLAGVYSFLPLEGEQTGLPFGIFGDFIPHTSRDQINYGVRWNHFMCDVLVTLLEDVISHYISKLDKKWLGYPAELLGKLQWSPLSGSSKEFWDRKMRIPLESFLENGTLYPDSDDALGKLTDLVIPDSQLLDLLGKQLLELALGKKIANPSIAHGLINRVDKVDVYSILFRPEVLETLKSHSGKLPQLYGLIGTLSDYYIRGREKRDLPLRYVDFVLADDNQFHSPSEVMLLQLELNELPDFLKAPFQMSDKKFLHPYIGQNEQAVEQLERCGMELVSRKNVLRRAQEEVAAVWSPAKCPHFWKYPDDLIRAHLFLFSNDVYEDQHLVTADDSLNSPKNTFAPGAPLDWEPLHKHEWIAPGYFPIHNRYFEIANEFGIDFAQVLLHLKKLGVHGFQLDMDEEIIQHSAYVIAKKKLEAPENGHKIEDVHDQTKLGYDLKCVGHCAAVFEVKGMGEPKDVPLEESEWKAAQPDQHKQFVLVCVYHLPTEPGKVGYKETTNVHDIGVPIEKAKVPKHKWLSS